MLDFNALDIGIMALLLVSTFIGIFRGFLREMLTIFIWSIALVVAYIHGKQVGEIFTFVESPAVKQSLGTGMIFVSLVIAGIVGKFFAFKAFNIGDPSAFDRMVGAAFGMARGYVIVVLTMVSVAGSPVAEQDWYKDSVIVARLGKSAEALGGNMPQKWKKFGRKKELIPEPEMVPVEESAPVPDEPASNTVTDEHMLVDP